MNTSAKVVSLENSEETQLRIDLAAALRLAAYYDWHEGVANHFSAAVSPDGKKFLMNPRWKHFSMAKASEMLLIDADDPDTMKRPDAP
ncbi:MAG: class II aldolase/adducin family protein, partial [Hoeflea sp.]|nr:class II aldolase/adducin family protein [Hoeflea sp.]